jgi:hypothetical protein
MKTLARLIRMLVVRAMAYAVGLSAVLVVVGHLRLGSASPGIFLVAASAFRFWIPLMFVLTATLAALALVKVLVGARRVAAQAGISLLECLDMSDDDVRKFVTAGSR